MLSMFRVVAIKQKNCRFLIAKCVCLQECLATLRNAVQFRAQDIHLLILYVNFTFYFVLNGKEVKTKIQTTKNIPKLKTRTLSIFIDYVKSNDPLVKLR